MHLPANFVWAERIVAGFVEEEVAAFRTDGTAGLEDLENT